MDISGDTPCKGHTQQCKNPEVGGRGVTENERFEEPSLWDKVAEVGSGKE